MLGGGGVGGWGTDDNATTIGRECVCVGGGGGIEDNAMTIESVCVVGGGGGGDR